MIIDDVLEECVKWDAATDLCFIHKSDNSDGSETSSYRCSIDRGRCNKDEVGCSWIVEGKEWNRIFLLGFPPLEYLSLNLPISSVGHGIDKNPTLVNYVRSALFCPTFNKNVC